jgi:hypothetical protein
MKRGEAWLSVSAAYIVSRAELQTGRLPVLHSKVFAGESPRQQLHRLGATGRGWKRITFGSSRTAEILDQTSNFAGINAIARANTNSNEISSVFARHSSPQ